MGAFAPVLQPFPFVGRTDSEKFQSERHF